MKCTSTPLYFFFIIIGLVLVQGQNTNNGYGSAKYSLILGVSGLGGEYLKDSSSFPNINSLILNGSSTLQARDALPTTSKPNWASIFSAGGPEETGVNSNFWYFKSNCVNYRVVDGQCVSCDSCSFVINSLFDILKDDPKVYNLTLNVLETVLHDLCNQLKFPLKQTCNTFVSVFVQDIFNAILNSDLQADFCLDVGACQNLLSPLNGEGNLFPTIFKMVKEHEQTLKNAFYTDSKLLVNLLEPNVIDYFSLLEEQSEQLVSDLIPIIEQDKPTVTFIHFNDVNLAGTSYGFGSPQYLSAIQKVDQDIGELLNAYNNAGILSETLILLTSDHGGEELSYNFSNQSTIYIPWIASGPGVNSNYQIEGYVRDMDIPATALWALGISPSSQWTGKAITEIYTSTPLQIQLPPLRLTDMVVIVTISGLTQNGIDQAYTPTIDEIVNNGASTSFARAVMPSTGISNIASILMGAGPEEHGVCTGDLDTPCIWSPPPAETSLPPLTQLNGGLFPTIFDIVKSPTYNQKGYLYNTSCFYNWANVSDFFTTSLDYQFQSSSDAFVASNASAYIQNANPGVVYIQFNEVEVAAEQKGFNTSDYFNAIESADQNLNTIFQTLAVYAPNTLLFITSDHGGLDTSVGETNDESIIVPWIAAGKFVRQHLQIANYVRVFDTASAAAFALQVAQPVEWIGVSPPIFQ